MNKKLRKTLSDVCKDFGLTDKALDELAEMHSQCLSEEASDEDVKKVADSLVPFAKMIQGEITRKTSKKNPVQETNPKKEEGGATGGGQGDNNEIAKLIAEQLAPFKTQLETMKAENDALKAERNKKERSSLIAEQAKKLGIPDYLIRRVSIADDADIEKELSEFKQELVTNNLMPKDAASVKATIEESLKADAKSWAESLPDK